MNELALFAGAGGGVLGGKLLGWRCVCAVEVNRAAAGRLIARQNDGCLPPFPIWDDIRTFDGRPWKGIVDVVSGGFPCQDCSCLNADGDGLDGERSGLWSEMCRVVCEVAPAHILVENSPMLTLRGLERVLGDMATLGYDAQWGVLGAYHAGGVIRRERLWIVASAPGRRLEGRQHSAALENWALQRRSAQALEQNPSWPEVSDPRTFGSPDDVAHRVDRLRAIGNGQVPAVVRLAWNVLGGS